MLLFVGMDWQPRVCHRNKTQKVSVKEWMAWFKRLNEQGIAVAGHPLGSEGKKVFQAESHGHGRAVCGSLQKEAIGGYFMLDVATMDEAVAIAQQCPGLPYGAKVEVRPVLAECPLIAEYHSEAARQSRKEERSLTGAVT